MNNKVHLAGAASFAAGILYGGNEIGISLAPVPFLAGALIGGLLPDIDTPKSYIGRRLFFISAIINKTLKHRYFCHSFLFAAITGSFVSLYNHDIGVGLTAGILSHIVLDLFSSERSGVALFYPFNKKRIRIR